MTARPAVGRVPPPLEDGGPFTLRWMHRHHTALVPAGSPDLVPTMTHKLLRSSFLRLAAPVALVALLAVPLRAGEVFSKPWTGSGTTPVNTSAWITPDGSDADFYSWDDFTLAETQTITEVRWRGGYKFNSQYEKAVDFRISFFDSIAGGSQPVIVALPEHEDQEVVIATFHTNNIAGETPAGSSGGVALYDYHFTLPTPVTLQGGVKYWFRVVAAQPGFYPDWGMASSNFGSHFAYNQGAHMFQNWPNDLTFSLHAKWVNLGHGLAGSAGVPALTGTGTLAGGSTSSLVLTSAKPSSTVWLVAGLSALNAPFKGGTLVPDPLLILDTVSNAAGSATLTFGMPVGLPAGVDIISQFWIPDPAGVHGFAASNGLTGTTP